MRFWPFKRRRDFSKLATRPNVAGIVCQGRTDGGGAQAHGRMSALAFARATGLPLFYSQLDSVNFGEGAEWLGKWENFIDFRSGIEPLPENLPLVTAKQALRRRLRRPTIVADEHFHRYTDENPVAYEGVRGELRERCTLLSEPIPVVAVHIRRGDVMDSEAEAFRRTPMELVARRIAQFPDMDIHVFSQGDPSDFAMLPDRCHLHLDEDVFDTLAWLINADVLIMAKSSFSYVAGVLSRGRVIYEPFWHSPLPSWEVTDIR